MILYYAMGGGLGHLTRSLAILSEIDHRQVDIRVLVSSRYAGLVETHMPCPVDVFKVNGPIHRKHYYQWLQGYLQTHRIERIVLDTFAWGLVGEWAYVGQAIPKDLIARDVKWPVYTTTVTSDFNVFPRRSLVIEPLGGYATVLDEYSDLTHLQGAICLPACVTSVAEKRDRKNVLIVHSGTTHEQRQLCSYAQEQLPGWNDGEYEVDYCFAQQGLYPAEDRLNHYDYVVAGAGYNMVANAWTRQTQSHYLLYPFERRYDDQFSRLKLYQSGMWQPTSDNVSQKAAEWIMEQR